jgi:hypothetical protein
MRRAFADLVSFVLLTGRRFSPRTHRVKEHLADGMRRQATQFLHPTVTGHARRIAHHATKFGVIRMLIRLIGRRQNHGRRMQPNKTGQGQHPGHRFLEVRVAAHVGELDSSAQQSSRRARLRHALPRRASCGRLTLGTNHAMGRPAGLRLPRNHAAAAKLNVIRVRAKGEQVEPVGDGGT